MHVTVVSNIFCSGIHLKKSYRLFRAHSAIANCDEIELNMTHSHMKVTLVHCYNQRASAKDETYLKIFHKDLTDPRHKNRTTYLQQPQLLQLTTGESSVNRLTIRKKNTGRLVLKKKFVFFCVGE